MPEALTESFCERCGTRYAFSAPSKLNPIRRTRGLASGIRQYLTSTHSLSDAVSDALHQEADSLSDRQMEAYHQVFSFCIECRQYACREKCWNDRLGRCLSCAPAVQLADGVEAWPGQDLLEPLIASRETLDSAIAPEPARGLGEAWPTSERSAPEATLEEPEPEPEPGVVAAEAPEAVVVTETDEFETADVEDPRTHLVSVAEQVEDTADVPDGQFEDEVGRREPALAVEPLPLEPRFPEIPAERIAAVVETPEAAARRAQLDLLGLPDPAAEAAPAARPTVLPHRPLPTPQAIAAPSPLWEASTRKVAGTDSDAFRVNECDHCGLSLSASARFCRRCGMRQARSA